MQISNIFMLFAIKSTIFVYKLSKSILVVEVEYGFT